jgi:hypothetical protein
MKERFLDSNKRVRIGWLEGESKAGVGDVLGNVPSTP